MRIIWYTPFRLKHHNRCKLLKFTQTFQNTNISSWWLKEDENTTIGNVDSDTSLNLVNGRVRGLKTKTSSMRPDLKSELGAGQVPPDPTPSAETGSQKHTNYRDRTLDQPN